MVHKMQAEKPAVQAVTPAPLDGRDTLQERDLPPQEPEGASKAQSTGLSTVFTKFAGMCISDLLFIEVFAGTARLSRIARETGFQVLPIDKTNARAPQMFIAQYDLADDNAVQSLLDLLETERDKIVAVHLAPACGTASKAREKQLSSGKTGLQDSGTPQVQGEANGSGQFGRLGQGAHRDRQFGLRCYGSHSQEVHPPGFTVLNREPRELTVLAFS